MKISDFDNYDPVITKMIIVGVFSHVIVKRISNPEMKKYSCTLLGLAFRLLIMWEHFWHHLLIMLSNIVLIKLVGPLKCHIVSLVYLFSYLGVYRLCNPSMAYFYRSPVSHVQMLTVLKLVSVAYDIHITNRERKKSSSETHDFCNYANEEPMNPSFMEMFHFTFSYIGMAHPPIIRFRTYQDFLYLPFGRSSKPGEFIKKQMLFILPCLPAAYLIKYVFPIEYIVTDEFKNNHFLYKNFFNFMHLMRHKLCMGSVFYLTECLTNMSGFGAYPTFFKSSSTHGPTVDYNHVKNISQEEADKLEYDFKTINSVTPSKVFFSPWHSEYRRFWNHGVQYFMARYIYKELVGSTNIKNKNLQIILTMVISAYWHGLELGWYTSMVVGALYIVAEKPYHKIYLYTTGWVSTMFKLVMWCVQMHIFSHFMMSTIVLRSDVILTHAAAMNYVPYFSLIAYYIIGKTTLSYLQRKMLTNTMKD